MTLLARSEKYTSRSNPWRVVMRMESSDTVKRPHRPTVMSDVCGTAWGTGEGAVVGEAPDR